MINLDSLINSDLVQRTKLLVENNPHHCEKNLYEHLMMTLGYFEAYSSVTDSNEFLLGQITCLLHDVGKCETANWTWSERSGPYLIFADHGRYGSRQVEDLLVKNGATPVEVYRICWMIEHHRKFWDDFNRPRMRKMYQETISRYIGIDLFSSFMCANVLGRIGLDGAQAKVIALQKFVSETKRQYFVPYVGDKRAYFMVGPSGLGKSTLSEIMIKKYDLEKIRYDKMRLDMFSQGGKLDYYQCHNISPEDEDRLANKCEASYLNLLKSGKGVIYDTICISKKNRRWAIKQAREHGYTPIAITIPISIDEMITRVNSRRTKMTSQNVSLHQYYHLEQPCLSFEEFDFVVPVSCNNFENINLENLI